MKLCIVYTVPIREEYRDFLANIAVRMRLMLPENVEISVIYNGTINTERLNLYNIPSYGVNCSGICKKIFIFMLLKTAWKTYRIAKLNDIDIFMNANNHLFLFAPALGAKLAGKKNL